MGRHWGQRPRSSRLDSVSQPREEGRFSVMLDDGLGVSFTTCESLWGMVCLRAARFPERLVLKKSYKPNEEFGVAELYAQL